jgi:hypothetical protein
MIEKIVKELHEKNLVERLIRKKAKWDTQTIYGDIHDYLKDVYMGEGLSLHDREVIAERLLGKYVIQHIYEINLKVK